MRAHAMGALRRLTLIAAAVFLALGVGTASAQATPRLAVADDVAIAADCNYVVVVPVSRIRSGPGTQYSVVRTKYQGDRLTGPAYCVPTSNGWWVVYLSTGGLGYAPKADLRYTG
ncbi:SH3 domain-containing protein [Saccharothrix sp. S26]|uniref:SH3 domain-containing protein n=1 Tax=Saccharothrix sp. S26 TaxID=2907215 RepID=UPI001F4185AF|nr:SH3 domain-containing protein [Saccharothrix sp. S26]MCE6997312.1 SH3 domain-containing protein [Saccharothrix sp. S26]